MLNVTDEQKQMFYSSGYYNNYTLDFPDIALEIDNDIIHSETPIIKESICDEEDFTLGGCIASSMEFTASEIIADQISGLEFSARINVADEEGNAVLSLPMGIYRVDGAQRVDDKDYKRITVYDRLYDASVDVSEWYHSLFPVLGTETAPSGEEDEDGNAIMLEKNVYGTTTAKAMRESLLRHLEIPFVVQELPNDSMTVEKTIEPSKGSLPGTTVLKALCTVNGGFGRMNREGKFEVIHLGSLGVFPEDFGRAAVPPKEGGNLYPSETLYPEDSYTYMGISDEENECPEYRSVTYEEYMTHPITCLNIQTDEEDAGVTIGDDTTNPYVITANFLLYGKSSEELEAIGGSIFQKIQGITYRPNTTELNGLPYLECGDAFLLEKRDDLVESYIFSRTLSGIQALKDTYEAKGNKIRANEVSQSEEIQQLKGKMLKITKECDKFAVSLADLEKDAESLLEMSATNILLQVTKEGKVVAMTLDAGGEETNFSIEADNINFTGKTFNLTSDKINIESDNFSVSETGAVSAKAIEISGGNINLTTGYDGEGLINLKNIHDIENLPYGVDSIAYFGCGNPGGLEYTTEVRTGEYYLDLDTGKIWLCNTHGGTYTNWTHIGGVVLSDILYAEQCMDTENGFVSEEYSKARIYGPDEEGNIKDLEFDIRDSASVNQGKICFKKTGYDDRGGRYCSNEIEGSLALTAHKQYPTENNPPTPILQSDVPFRAPNIASGSVLINITGTNTTFTKDVELDMPRSPSVVATPVTSGPGAVSVSVGGVSESGFTIYITRSDGKYDTAVNWIAMC